MKLTNAREDGLYSVKSYIGDGRGNTREIANPQERERRAVIALECLKALLANPSRQADYLEAFVNDAFVLADRFIEKASEP